MSAQTPEFIPRCSKCEYELTGVPDGPCPECGKVFVIANLREAWLATLPLQNDEAMLRGFLPRCNSCRYDLAGLPDGVCPECGTSFTLDGLKQRWIQDRRAKTLSPGLVATVVAAALNLVWIGSLGDIASEPPSMLALGALVALASGWWAWVFRKRLLVTHPLVLALHCPVVLLLALIQDIHLLSIGPFIALPWAVGVAVVWAGCANRHPGVLAFLAATCMLPVGIIGTVRGCVGLASGRYWSHVNELFIPLVRLPQPLRLSSELIVSTVYLAVGLFFFVCARRIWSRRPRVIQGGEEQTL